MAPKNDNKAKGRARRDPANKEQRDGAARALREAAERRRVREIGGPKGPEPTRYGDWERKGICYDF